MAVLLYDGIMKVLISGASGYIGQRLTKKLLERGDEVVHLVRREPNSDATVREVMWDPMDAESVDPSELDGVEIVFNMSGASVAKRWSKEYLDIIASSRIDSTTTLVEVCRRMSNPPTVLITASGVAIYGNRGDEQLTESSERGDGILADIAVPWEAATDSASEFGVRAVTARFGVVLGADGGALPTFVSQFRLGFGGRLGNGKQWSPWIHTDDAVSALLFIAENESLSGPVNVVSPGVARNIDLMRAIGAAIGKPVLGWMPAIVAPIVIGNYVKELALNSVFVIPEKLLDAGFEFENPDLRQCMVRELGRDSLN